MLVYPEIESWDEFYPSEIFIRHEPSEDAFSVIKMANIGATIYAGNSSASTQIYKKIGKIEAVPDMDSSLILIGYVTAGNKPTTPTT